MPSFSPFWYKHYKDIGFCCTLQPLQESPTGYTKDDPYVVTFMDTQWIADKKLKWIGTDRRGEAAWIDPQGMVYNFNELKRNEKGKEYEKGGKKLQIEDQSITQYGDNKKDFYEWELEILKTCGFCHNHRPDPTPDREDEERGGTAKVETEDDAWQDIMNGSSSDLDIVTETGDVAFSGHVTDADDVADAGNFADQNYNEGYANEQGQIPGEENNAYIPPVPYKPPVPLPTEDETPPPSPRPRVVPPMNENPVLMSRKLVTDNSKATKTLFKMPKEEDIPLVPNVQKLQYPELPKPHVNYKYYSPMHQLGPTIKTHFIDSVTGKYLGESQTYYSIKKSENLVTFPTLNTNIRTISKEDWALKQFDNISEPLQFAKDQIVNDFRKIVDKNKNAQIVDRRANPYAKDTNVEQSLVVIYDGNTNTIATEILPDILNTNHQVSAFSTLVRSTYDGSWLVPAKRDSALLNPQGRNLYNEARDGKLAVMGFAHTHPEVYESGIKNRESSTQHSSEIDDEITAKTKLPDIVITISVTITKSATLKTMTFKSIAKQGATVTKENIKIDMQTLLVEIEKSIFEYIIKQYHD